MKLGLILSGALAVCGPLLAVPAVADESPLKAPTRASAAVAGPTLEKPAPLDLRVGDIRKYMTPEEFRALSEPLDESNTVVVQASGPLLPMKSELDVPGGIIAPFWALANPHKAWRLFLPDARVNIKNIPPPESKIPPPVFRWGP
jgi:hypothetical protein